MAIALLTGCASTSPTKAVEKVGDRTFSFFDAGSTQASEHIKASGADLSIWTVGGGAMAGVGIILLAIGAWLNIGRKTALTLIIGGMSMAFFGYGMAIAAGAIIGVTILTGIGYGIYKLAYKNGYDLGFENGKDALDGTAHA